MSVAAVSRRTVVEYQSDKGVTNYWIPQLITQVENKEFVRLTYQGDRGFARFCAGKMNQSSPLTEFGWLEVAQKVRNAATDIALDKLAAEKDIGHTPGTRVKNRVAYATHLPDAVDVVLPAISFGDKSIGETNVQMVPMIAPKSAVVIECTAQSMAYVQLAMHASAKDTVSRARSEHHVRFSAATGVLGAAFNKSNSD